MSSAADSWIDRSALATVGVRATNAQGLLRSSPIADTVVPFTGSDLVAAGEVTRATLGQAGITAKDRAVVALNSDGDLTGVLLAQAAADVAAAAASVGARGRMRLLASLEAVRASVLVATPTGVADFLARLHLEFLVDPLDLELRTILVVGEISDARTYRHIATEFGARVVQVYVDPVFGVALAARDATDPESSLEPTRPEFLSLGALGENQVVETAGDSGHAEIVLTPTWHSTLANSTIRTGEVVRVVGDGKGLPPPSHTVGDHILVKGRWISLVKLRSVLSKIDGIGQWTLKVRREGTLDSATLSVVFTRSTLTQNPMWRGRLEQALASVTPISIVVEIAPEPDETVLPPRIEDLRGHHLGQDRSKI